MDINKQYIINKHIKYEISGGEIERVLIIPVVEGTPDMRRVLCLSDTSLDIWKMLTEKINVVQIIEALVCKYKVESEKIERDVLDFLRALLDQGYIFDEEKEE